MRVRLWTFLSCARQKYLEIIISFIFRNEWINLVCFCESFSLAKFYFLILRSVLKYKSIITNGHQSFQYESLAILDVRVSGCLFFPQNDLVVFLHVITFWLEINSVTFMDLWLFTGFLFKKLFIDKYTNLHYINAPSSSVFLGNCSL